MEPAWGSARDLQNRNARSPRIGGNTTIWNRGGAVLIMMHRPFFVLAPQSCHVLTRKVRHETETDRNDRKRRRSVRARRIWEMRTTQNAATGAPGTAVITKTKPQTKRPSLYRVLLLNDDYTPMEFVVHVLERFFNKDHEAAHRIMMHVHQHGIGECGIYTYEVAETKVTQVMDFARKHQHPLQCVMEKK